MPHLTRRLSALVLSLSLGLGLGAAQAQTVKLVTTEGDILIQLNPEAAPKSVANFLKYVNAGFYDGTIFHRVIPNFMIQGGGYTSKLQPKETYKPIALESRNGLLNERGTVAMARQNAPDTATSQFFINVKDNPFLNADEARDGYAVFGKVISGMEVVDAIKATPTKQVPPFFEAVPEKTILIKKATVEK